MPTADPAQGETSDHAGKWRGRADSGSLRYNGSLSIRHVLGAPMLVMSRTFPRDRVRTSESRDAIMEIARRSDQIEQQLTQLDQY